MIEGDAYQGIALAMPMSAQFAPAFRRCGRQPNHPRLKALSV